MSHAIIDPHVHLFDLEQGDYSWLQNLNDKQRDLIARSFTTEDLTLDNDLHLAGIVHIEAGFDNSQPWREIQYLENAFASEQQPSQNNLLKPVEKSSSIALKSVGHIELNVPDIAFAQSVNKQAQCDSCIALRQILENEGETYFKQAQVLKNLRYLAQSGLMLELQMPFHNPSAVSSLIQALQNVPELKVIVNHAGFFPFSKHKATSDKASDAIMEMQHTWRQNIQMFASEQNTYIKCSGWEMSNSDYQQEGNHGQLIRCLEHLADCFGEKRMMFASNFPLVLYSSEYSTYWQFMIKLSSLCGLDVHRLCYQNAKDIYRF